MDLGLALTLGFHNARRALLNDQVRRPNRITGSHSSLRAAGKELSLAIFDSITGIYTKLKQGFEEEGIKGCLKGIGRASIGPIFRISAGISGLCAFPMKGIHQEFRKNRDRAVIQYISDLRGFHKGELAWREAPEKEKKALREQALKGWLIQAEIEFRKKERYIQLERDISRGKGNWMGPSQTEPAEEKREEEVKEVEEAGCLATGRGGKGE